VLPVHAATLLQDEILDGPVGVGEDFLDLEEVVVSPRYARGKRQRRRQDSLHQPFHRASFYGRGVIHESHNRAPVARREENSTRTRPIPWELWVRGVDQIRV